MELGSFDRAAADVEVDVAVRESGEVLFTGPVPLGATIAGSVEEVLAPVQSPEIDGCIASGLQLRLLRRRTPELRNAPSRIDTRLEVRAPDDPLLSDLTLGVRIEFRHGQRLVAFSEFWLRDLADGVRPAFIAPLRSDLEALASADAADPSWTFHIRGCGEVALRDFRATRHWSGQLSRPLAEVVVEQVD